MYLFFRTWWMYFLESFVFVFWFHIKKLNIFNFVILTTKCSQLKTTWTVKIISSLLNSEPSSWQEHSLLSYSSWIIPKVFDWILTTDFMVLYFCYAVFYVTSVDLFFIKSPRKNLAGARSGNCSGHKYSQVDKILQIPSRLTSIP